jgi:hypothetical protein
MIQPMTMKKMSIVEIHIAIPKSAITHTVIAELARAGFVKAKFFLQVYDVRSTTSSCNPNTPPTGHDIPNPGMMFTLKVPSVEDAIERVREGMRVLRALHVYGNFEIEGQIGEVYDSYRSIDIKKELSGYRVIQDAPAYENHIVWRGTQDGLPSHEEIISFVEQKVGFLPHQIVDFARVETVGSTDIVSRVATIYQPNKESVFAFSKKLSPKKAEGAFAYEIGERVMLVGEPA